MARSLQGQIVSMSPRQLRHARAQMSQHVLAKPAQRLYEWFSENDPDPTVKYPDWQDMTVDQRAWWIQAAGATLEDA